MSCIKAVERGNFKRTAKLRERHHVLKKLVPEIVYSGGIRDTVAALRAEAVLASRQIISEEIAALATNPFSEPYEHKKRKKYLQKTAETVTRRQLHHQHHD